MRILGIDPGLGITGFGVIDADAGSMKLVAVGDIRPPRKDSLPERLAFLKNALSRHIRQNQPEIAVLERVFTHYRHVTTAAKMAHARGAVCLAVQEHGIELIEYLPTRVKHAVTGKGNASKQQVASMVGQWIHVSDASWSFDATDALALAIAHAHILESPAGLRG